jgi:hypothetical protein
MAEVIENRDPVTGNPIVTPVPIVSKYPNTLDNRPYDTRTNDELNRAQTYTEVTVPTRHLRASLNAFKMATEDAFHKLSVDISNLSRPATIPTDPNVIRETFEGLQMQLRNIRNSFHSFNFGLNEPLETDVVYDRDPLNYKRASETGEVYDPNFDPKKVVVRK